MGGFIIGFTAKKKDESESIVGVTMMSLPDDTKDVCVIIESAKDEAQEKINEYGEDWAQTFVSVEPVILDNGCLRIMTKEEKYNNFFMSGKFG